MHRQHRADAQVINQLLPSEAILLNRAAKGKTRMGLGDDTGSVAAVIVETLPGADKEVVRDTIKRWGDVEVLTKQDQETLLLDGRLGNLQIIFPGFHDDDAVHHGRLALTIYTMTIEKVAQIALLFMIGARDRVIIGMIAQQAGLIGFCGLALAIAISFTIYPRFPRTVLITESDLGVLSAVLMALGGPVAVVGYPRGAPGRIRASDAGLTSKRRLAALEVRNASKVYDSGGSRSGAGRRLADAQPRRASSASRGRAARARRRC